MEGEDFAMGVSTGLVESEVAPHLIGAVEITDVYSPTTIIVAGHRDEVVQSIEACVAAGADDSMLLPVTAPFHSTALRSVRAANAAALDGVALSVPSIPVISAVSAGVLETAEDVREELVTNVSTPMRWFDVMTTLLERGAGAFYEAGRSRRLATLVQRRLPELEHVGSIRQWQVEA